MSSSFLRDSPRVVVLYSMRRVAQKCHQIPTCRHVDGHVPIRAIPFDVFLVLANGFEIDRRFPLFLWCRRRRRRRRRFVGGGVF